MFKKENILSIIILLFLIIMYMLFNQIFIVISIIVLLILLISKKFKINSGLILVIIVLMALKVFDYFMEYDILLIFIVLLLLQSLNYLTSEIFKKQENDKFIKEKLFIAKKDMLSNSSTIIMISNDNKNVLWANQIAYDEFPFLLKDQSFTLIPDIVKNDILKYENKIYTVTNNDGIYYLNNITMQEREHNKLKNLQLIIGLIQIDNHSYLEQTLDQSKFLEMDTKIKLLLIEWFKSENIFYQQIDDDKFQINIPFGVLESNIKERFPNINRIVSELKDAGFDVTLSVGIAYNYSNNLEIGQMATEALELANSRGGAQIVIFNNGKRSYFGGRISNAKSNSKIRSRFVYNTIVNNANDSDVIYLMSHKNLDLDGLSALALTYEFLKGLNREIKVLVDRNSKEVIHKKIVEIFDVNTVLFDSVVDKTKKNLLIIVDTQSKSIISHPHIYEEIMDCIVIDHHQTPENYIDVTLFSWIEPTASSTTEMITNMFISVDLKLKNSDIGKLALLGILTDTNNLKFRVSESTISVIGYLVSQGTTLLEAMEELDITTKDYVMKRDLISQVNISNGIAIIETDKEVPDDLQSIVANELVEIREIIVSIVICKIKQDKYKVKLRTNGKINGKVLLEEYGGGGHIRQAAGVFSASTIEEIKEKLFKLDLKNLK